MAETEKITSLWVVTDSETAYDDIGDIQGGMFNEEWLDKYIRSHGAGKLTKAIAEMIVQVGTAEKKIMQEKYAMQIPVENVKMNSDVRRDN